eukprot:4812964-Prymnesium_polylepis.2
MLDALECRRSGAAPLGGEDAEVTPPRGPRSGTPPREERRGENGAPPSPRVGAPAERRAVPRAPQGARLQPHKRGGGQR